MVEGSKSCNMVSLAQCSGINASGARHLFSCGPSRVVWSSTLSFAHSCSYERRYGKTEDLQVCAISQQGSPYVQVLTDEEERLRDIQLAAEAATAALAADNEEILRLDKQAVIDAEARLFVPTYVRSPVVFERGEGCKLYDTEGKEYLDLAAGIAVNSLGHGDPTWLKAINDQAANLAHVSNLYHTVPQVKLAERLVKWSFADRVFFTNSGTEANDAAIKFARKYQTVISNRKGDTRWIKFGKLRPASELVSFSSGFHGRTSGAQSHFSKLNLEPLAPGAHCVEFGDLETTAKAIRRDRTAAVLVEPIQGEGGVHTASAEFLRGLRRLCDEAGALLIFDEVQCGLGRTGLLWAHQAYGVQPDMMTLAKPLAGGLPIGAVLVTEAVASTISAGDHGSTFAGGPLVCQAALSVLDRIQAPGFLEHVAAKGGHLRAQLREKIGTNPHVKEIRGVGLLIGVELDVPAAPLVEAALQAGLLILTAGNGYVVKLAPPLTISEAELNRAVDIIAGCMSSLFLNL
ncbi:acetylornithine aminotransferase, mitochondrial [Physcomitrium patens]|uniref:Uncharacterized protein n=1 Tax=Physcomitrium patens TaxID=3218 RepID=A0A2K1J9U3_PHYPA|nr:acetylornithine aminotransferase, mitochondrial-like [Physcomitrium patens]PNR38296.1 hypothetical protein PHYPA_021407 [Physcomitrium patens]|eukprot:XP_024398741.1 acetylornithine aminotransferase, mitochondrial-like [Physcomitrella patens]